MKVSLGCDHAGFIYKEAVKSLLIESGHEVLDYGTSSFESCDYPDSAHDASKAVEEGSAERAVLICGSGNGVNMVANKYASIRCALCWTAEITRFARTHNDANALALPARFISEYQAKSMVKIFMETEFEGGRHARRRDKIPIRK